jgi:glycosyltransferase involved in cell wall biosynthesis
MSERFISQTIESVLSQTYQDWEMIIIDDCSPDNVNNLIKEYISKDNRIKLIKLEKNIGPANARNEGIKQAKGKYIAFLDSDDIWFPKKLEKQLKFKP